MSMLPARPDRDLGRDSRQVAQAARAQRRTELAIFRHALDAQYRAEVDRLDTQAAADSIRASLDEELDLLSYGLHRAGSSAAGAELVSRKVEMLSNINNRRINRRFLA